MGWQCDYVRVRDSAYIIYDINAHAGELMEHAGDSFYQPVVLRPQRMKTCDRNKQLFSSLTSACVWCTDALCVLSVCIFCVFFLERVCRCVCVCVCV